MAERRWLKPSLVAAAVALVGAIPAVGTGYIIRFTTTVMMYVGLAQAWNIIGGYGGYISLGLVGFLGLGAYTTGILMAKAGWGFPSALLAGGGLSALVSLAVGAIVLRLRAGYFAIATFSVAYVVRELANNLTDVTGGGMGLSVPLFPGGIEEINRFFYAIMLMLATMATLLAWLMGRSRLGYGLRAIKADEEAAGVLGVNTTLYKVVAFVLSGLIAGLIGGAYGYWLTFLDPLSMFDPTLSVTVIIMVLLGGAGNWLGVAAGAVIVSILSEVLWSKFLEVHLGFLGALLMIVVLFFPRGLADALAEGGRLRSGRAIVAHMRQNLARYRV